jgi:hypothetical protein
MTLAGVMLASSPAPSEACTFRACYPPYPGGDCGFNTWTEELFGIEDSDCYYCQVGYCHAYDAFGVECHTALFEVCLYPK